MAQKPKKARSVHPFSDILKKNFSPATLDLSVKGLNTNLGEYTYCMTLIKSKKKQKTWIESYIRDTPELAKYISERQLP